MALRDITLGQFFPGTSLIHRLDPRTKILYTLFFIVALFMAGRLPCYLVMILVLAVGIAITRIPFSVFRRGLKPIVLIVVLTAVLNLFFTSGGTVLFQFGFLKITVDGAWRALFMMMRIIMLLFATLLLTYTTSPLLLTDGMERLMRPLKHIHVPVHDLAMMMSIALRFIPTLISETDKIISAQKARGADFETGSLLQRAKALIPILVPLFISAFRRAEELAVAMECRCYHGDEGRTRLRQLKYRGIDIFFLLLGPMLCVVMLVMRHFGL